MTELRVWDYHSEVKRHFLESELKTADFLVQDYMRFAATQDECESGYVANRLKLVWLLERLQESVL